MLPTSAQPFSADRGTDTSPVPDHHCLVCRVYAGFGFTTRRGVVWACLEHRAVGEKLHVQESNLDTRSGTL